MQGVLLCTRFTGRYAEFARISRLRPFYYGSARRLFGEVVTLRIFRLVGPY